MTDFLSYNNGVVATQEKVFTFRRHRLTYLDVTMPKPHFEMVQPVKK